MSHCRNDSNVVVHWVPKCQRQKIAPSTSITRCLRSNDIFGDLKIWNFEKDCPWYFLTKSNRDKHNEKNDGFLRINVDIRLKWNSKRRYGNHGKVFYEDWSKFHKSEKRNSSKNGLFLVRMSSVWIWIGVFREVILFHKRVHYLLIQGYMALVLQNAKWRSKILLIKDLDLAQAILKSYL